MGEKKKSCMFKKTEEIKIKKDTSQCKEKSNNDCIPISSNKKLNHYKQNYINKMECQFYSKSQNKYNEKKKSKLKVTDKIQIVEKNMDNDNLNQSHQKLMTTKNTVATSAVCRYSNTTQFITDSSIFQKDLTKHENYF